MRPILDTQAPAGARRRTAWGVMLALGILTSLFTAGTLLSTAMRSPVAADMFARSAVGTALHIVGGMVALLGGALQMNTRIRTRHRRFHRGVGLAYGVAVLIGGLTGLRASFHSFGGIVTHLGFGALAVGWLLTTAEAFRAIFQRDIPGHQRWMIRSYALTLAAVMLRIYMPVSGLAGVPFEPAYQAVAWLCWVPNLAVAELWFVPRRGREDALSLA